MADDRQFSEVDLSKLPRTEQDQRYHDLNKVMREGELTYESLQKLSDSELTYLAGHRDWIESPSDHGHPALIQREFGARIDAEAKARGVQQKVRGNAWRAKDELDRRMRDRELAALDASNAVVAESNRHMKTTADQTRKLVHATIGLVIVGVVTTIVTVTREPRVTVQPARVRIVAPATTAVTLPPTTTPTR